jgi:hypothetical protein
MRWYHCDKLMESKLLFHFLIAYNNYNTQQTGCVILSITMLSVAFYFLLCGVSLY